MPIDQTGEGDIKEKYLIVNADDFGLDSEIDRGIIESIEKGPVRSVSLVANGENFKNAVFFLKHSPEVAAGIHLCLTQEKPVLPPEEIPSLATENGSFNRSFLQLSCRLFCRNLRHEDISRELEAQIIKLIDNGIYPHHIDSHQYIHLFPSLLKVVISLARKYNIGWLRYPLIGGGFCRLSLNAAVKIFWSLIYSRGQLSFAHNNSINTPGRSYGSLFSGQLNSAIMKRFLKDACEGVNDITCHPGYSPEGGKYAAWGYNWENEMRVLTAETTSDLINELKLRVTNYEKL